MPENNPFSILDTCPLFRGVDRDTIGTLHTEGRIAVLSFRAGEEIPISYGDERALVILTKGVAHAYSLDAERSVILRTIPAGTAFGVSVLFSDEPPVSVIRAKTTAEALFFPSSAVELLIADDAAFRMNYVAFLSGRIRFLNRRIACYTAGTAERKLALYLTELPEISSGIALLDVSLTDLSEMLDVGRASLYRAFSALSDAGLIRRVDRRIEILDRDGLLRYGTSSDT